MTLVVNLNPTLQKTIVLPSLRENEVNRSIEDYLDASGKGLNLVRVMGQLGAPARLLSHTGGRNGPFFRDLAAADGVQVTGPDSGAEIRHCYTLINREKGEATEIIEKSRPITPGTEGQLRRDFSRLLPQCGLLILTGTRAPGYSESLFADFTAAAREGDKRILLDLQGEDLRACVARGPDLIKPNFAEFAATFVTGGAFVGEFQTDPVLLSRVQKEAEALSRRGVAVVLTRGGLPALCALEGEVFFSAPGKTAVQNPIGSGDAFAAGFAVHWQGAGLPAPGTGAFAALFRPALEAGHRAAAANAANLRPGRIS